MGVLKKVVDLFIAWLRWKIAGDQTAELVAELASMKLRAEEVILWCDYEFPQASAAGRYILDMNDYPGQGSRGFIGDFRQYMRNEYLPSTNKQDET